MIDVKTIRDSAVEILARQQNKRMRLSLLVAQVDTSQVDLSKMQNPGARTVVVMRALDDLEKENIIWSGEGDMVGMRG